MTDQESGGVRLLLNNRKADLGLGKQAAIFVLQMAALFVLHHDVNHFRFSL